MSKSSSSNTSDKKEVFLRTFSKDNGDPDGFIKRAGDAFKRTLYKYNPNHGTADILEVQHDSEDAVGRGNLPSLWGSASAILQAINDGSPDVVYSVEPCDEPEVMSTFHSCVLHGLRCESKRLHAKELEIAPPLPSNYKGYSLISIGFVDCDIPGFFSHQWCHVREAGTLKEYLRSYAKDIKGVKLHSLWFEYPTGGSIYLSDIGQKTVAQCGLKHGDYLFVSPKIESSSLTRNRAPLQKLHDNKCKMKQSKGKKKAKSKKKGTKTVQSDGGKQKAVKDELNLWMDSLAIVHDEAAPLFKKKREELYAMKLERTAPKERKMTPKHIPAMPTNNTPTSSLERKAGKSNFLIRVGEVMNLYNTSKPSSKKLGSLRTALPVLDLHGYTREKALEQLNTCLPQWVDTAMKGEYPWFIYVKIVCGGGNQVLSEAVESWIKETKNVANAPKLHS